MRGTRGDYPEHIPVGISYPGDTIEQNLLLPAICFFLTLLFDNLNGNVEIVEQDTNQSIATLVAAAKVNVMRTVLKDKWKQVPQLSAERHLVLDHPSQI